MRDAQHYKFAAAILVITLHFQELMNFRVPSKQYS